MSGLVDSDWFQKETIGSGRGAQSGDDSCRSDRAAARGSVIADLRANYDAGSPLFVDGQTAVGKIPDSLGLGSWTFFSRYTSSPGGESPLVYTTAANGVRNANAFVSPGGVLDLAGLSNSQLIAGAGEGSPSANELAVHPGFTGDNYQYLVMRWTSGSDYTTPVTVDGALRDMGVVGDGVSLSIQDFLGTSLFSGNTSGNLPLSFHFDTAVATGNYLDFVIGAGPTFSGDQSAIFATMDANPAVAPEPSSLLLAGCASLWPALRLRARRKRARVVATTLRA
jgi:hypothetical protein